MGEYIGRNRKARRAYGFDEIALVPGNVTIDPADVDISWNLGPFKFEIPILASAMDGVVSPSFAIEMGKLGGLAVLNLEGIQTRYENPDEILEKIATASEEEATRLLQEVYKEPIKAKLIKKRVQQIKDGGVVAAASLTPIRVEEFYKYALDGGLDILVVQSTVTTARHKSSRYRAVNFEELRKKVSIPIMVGNVVTYRAALELFETGIDAILVGVGPGAACTTRQVLGVGVPQVTATADVAAARDFFFKRTNKYIPVITDGGMRTGGDICKAIAAGADAVMIGSPLAAAKEAPGRGYHWGMATPHPDLPRGTRIKVGITGTLKEILFGPARTDDGTQNLVGALKNSMGLCGAQNIKQMQQVELVIAPSIKTEGKELQRSQGVGMGR